MMLENLEKVGGATQSYIDMVEKTMRGFPGANEEQIRTFKAYIDGKLQPTETSGRSFCAPRIFRRPSAIQAEYFQSQLKACAEDATQIGAKIAGSFNRRG
jgi:hypothetical protein